MKAVLWSPVLPVLLFVVVLLAVPWGSSWQMNLASLDLISERSSQANERLYALAQRGFEPAHQRLADLEITAGQFAQAEARLVRMQHPDAISWYTLGFGYWEEGDIPAAQRSWERFIVRHPRAIYNLVWQVQRSRLGDRSQLRPVMAELAGQAAEAAPNYELAYLLAGDLSNAEDPTAAERVYRQAVVRFPYSADARLRLADLLITQGRDLPAALDLIQQALELGSQRPSTYALMGQCLEALGRGREAIPWYVRAVETGRKNFEQYQQLLHNACQQYGPADGCP